MQGEGQVLCVSRFEEEFTSRDVNLIDEWLEFGIHDGVQAQPGPV